MKAPRFERHEGWRADVRGGLLTFLIEAGVVVALGVLGLVVAALVLVIV